jgi:hypothetical protein
LKERVEQARRNEQLSTETSFELTESDFVGSLNGTKTLERAPELCAVARQGLIELSNGQVGRLARPLGPRLQRHAIVDG